MEDNGYISKTKILKKYNGDFNNPKCKEELKIAEMQNERYILNSMNMDKEVQEALEKYAYQTTEETINGVKPTFEIDWDKFLSSEEHKKLLEKCPKKELLSRISRSAPMVCAMKLVMLNAEHFDYQEQINKSNLGRVLG